MQLDAGTYTLELVNPATNPDAIFTAWATDASPGSWRTDFDAEGEVDPGLSGGSAILRATAQDAFDLTSPRIWELTLTTAQRVYFGVPDDAVLDNSGGVSLSLAVPEPSVVLMLAAGVPLLAGLAQRSRERRGARMRR